MTTVEPAPTLRDRQKEVTRDLILGAVAKLMERSTCATSPSPTSPRRPGVASGPIYRHFPTKEELLEVFWTRMQERLGAPRSARGRVPSSCGKRR
jgi:hypothetical protein